MTQRDVLYKRNWPLSI